MTVSMAERGTDHSADVDQLADALLDAVEEGVDQEQGLLGSALGAVRRLAIDFVRRYNRL